MKSPMTRFVFVTRVFSCVAAAAVVAGGLNNVALSEQPATPVAEQVPQLRRLTEAQYRRSIADIFGSDIVLNGRFEPDIRVNGLLAAGTSAVSLTPGGAEQYETLARSIAAQVVDPAHRDKLIGCAPGPDDPDGAACASRFFDRVGKQLYRRPLVAAERAFVTSSALAAAKELGDFHGGIAASLAGMLTDVPFLFRTDRVVADPAKSGQRTLDGWSRATRLSYLMWNTTPDDELLRAAGSGDLMTAAGLKRQVDRLMASPRFAEGARAFFDDFLNLEGMTTLSKDSQIYPAYRATVSAEAREQTLRTVTQLLIADRKDYRDLFTSRKVAMSPVLSPLYRIRYAPNDWSMIELPADSPRAGLLTQISFLALHSHEGRTSPTLRGKALREIFMCEHIPAPPANVNFTIVQDTSNKQFRTTRERLQAHLDDEECASCHRLTDPMGLTLEKFDGAGQFRETENDVPIDTSGALNKVAVKDAESLGRALHDNPAVPQCLVQSAWRYAIGRETLAREEPVVANLQQQFAASGYLFADLLRSIATSPDFYRASASPAMSPFRQHAAHTTKRKGSS